MSEKGENGQSTPIAFPSDVKKAGTLRKLKTMKKKYFVLRAESDNGPARLEYYDSEKKYRTDNRPKRSISIKKCFNINRKIDAKQKLVIALYTKDDCFSVVTENEQSLDEWLKAMLELQLDATSVNGNTVLKPKFEHVWQVNIGEKSLACSRNMKGLYRLCLTNSSLTLVKMEQSDNPESLEFPLMSIRRCGHSNNYFFFELGRSSVTGAGELWLETEDVVIAQNMHEVTLNAMKTCREHEDMGPHRPRSSSNTETSRPIATRRPIAVVNAQPSVHPSIRNRCDSMPSRPRTISEGQEVGNRNVSRGYSSHHLDSFRSHIGYSQSISYSPPGMPNPLSPCSTGYSTDSAGSSLSIEEHDGGMTMDFTHMRYSHAIPTDGLTEPSIKEEQPDTYMSMNMNNDSSTEKNEYVHMVPMYNTPNEPEKSLYLNCNSENSYTNRTASQGSDYMDMTSPISLPGDYIPMSPIGSEIAKMDIENGHKSSDDYLYMGPTAQSSHNYMDMAPLSSSLPVTSYGNMDTSNLRNENCATSNSSIASSTDASKPQIYQLDKVKSLLLQPDDTSEDYIRPVRAYSMGSRPQVKKTHLSVHNELNSELRIRAYSVGSQAANSRKKTLNSADQEFGSIRSMNIKVGTKSSSAPLLHNRPQRLRASGSRGEINEDLMEIDYDKTRSLNDKDFTIEPVGRTRSGSYSSSSAKPSFSKIERRLYHDQDKHGINIMGKNRISNNDLSSDYLSMLPSSNKPKSSSGSKSKDSDFTSGDYVSLNPSVKYPLLNNIRAMSPENYITSPLPNTNPSELSAKTSLPLSKEKPTSKSQINKVHSHSEITKHMSEMYISDPGYLCMDFTKRGNTISQSEECIAATAQADKHENVCNKEKTVASSCDLHNLCFPENEESPKTDSELSNTRSNDLTTNSSTVCSYDDCLNYAALDLPPSGMMDNATITSIMPVHLSRQINKTVPIYAQINFLSSNPETLKEDTSYL